MESPVCFARFAEMAFRQSVLRSEAQVENFPCFKNFKNFGCFSFLVPSWKYFFRERPCIPLSNKSRSDQAVSSQTRMNVDDASSFAANIELYVSPVCWDISHKISSGSVPWERFPGNLLFRSFCVWACVSGWMSIPWIEKCCPPHPKPTRSSQILFDASLMPVWMQPLHDWNPNPFLRYGSQAPTRRCLHDAFFIANFSANTRVLPKSGNILHSHFQHIGWIGFRIIAKQRLGDRDAVLSMVFVLTAQIATFVL